MDLYLIGHFYRTFIHYNCSTDLSVLYFRRLLMCSRTLSTLTLKNLYRKTIAKIIKTVCFLTYLYLGCKGRQIHLLCPLKLIEMLALIHESFCIKTKNFEREKLFFRI